MVHIGVIRRWCKKNDIDFFECIKMIKNIMTNILSSNLNPLSGSFCKYAEIIY
jgi:hypothetical protein